MANHDSLPEARAAAAGGTWLFAGNLLGRFLVYLSLVLLARYLPVDETGRFLLALTIVQGIVVVAVSGFDQGFFHFAPRLAQSGDTPALHAMLEGATVWLALVGFLAAGLLVWLSPWIGSTAEDPGLAYPLSVFALFLPFMVLLRALTAACQALSRIGAAVVLRNVIYPVLTIVGLAVLLPRVPGAGTAAGVMGGASLAAILVGWVWLRPKKAHVGGGATFRWTRRLVWFSAPLLATAVLGYLTLWTDSLVVGFYLPAQDMATYGLVYRVSLVGVIIVEAFSGSLGPAAARALVVHKEDLQAIYAATARRGMLFFLPVFALGVVFPRAVIGVFGRDYVSGDSVNMLRLLMAGQFVNVTAGGAGMLLVVAGRRWLSLANGAGAAMLTGGLCLLLVPRAGIVGGALAAAGSVAAVNLARILEVRRVLGVHPFSLALCKPFLAACLGTGAGLLVARYHQGPRGDWAGIVAMVSIYLLVLGMAGHARGRRGLVEWLVGKKNGPRAW